MTDGLVLAVENALNQCDHGLVAALLTTYNPYEETWEEWEANPDLVVVSKKRKRVEVEVEVEKDEPECSVCLCPLSDEETRSLPCAHVFHSGCINRWLKKKPFYCPLDKIIVPKQWRK